MTSESEQTQVSEVQIRRAIPGDIEAIVRLDLESDLTAWESSDYRAFVEFPDWDVLVAGTQSGVLLGFIVNRRVGLDAELLKIAVARTRRRRGVGRTLLEAGLLAARQAGCAHCFLEVRPSNSAALALYRGNGFLECGVRPSYYHDPPESALLMSKKLSPEAEK